MVPRVESCSEQVKNLSGVEPNLDRGQDRMKQKLHKVIQPQNTVPRSKHERDKMGLRPHKQKLEFFLLHNKQTRFNYNHRVHRPPFLI
jgi:hypothetical protein